MARFCCKFGYVVNGQVFHFTQEIVLGYIVKRRAALFALLYSYPRALPLSFFQQSTEYISLRMDKCQANSVSQIKNVAKIFNKKNLKHALAKAPGDMCVGPFFFMRIRGNSSRKKLTRFGTHFEMRARPSSLLGFEDADSVELNARFTLNLPVYKLVLLRFDSLTS